MINLRSFFPISYTDIYYSYGKLSDIIPWAIFNFKGDFNFDALDSFLPSTLWMYCC